MEMNIKNTWNHHLENLLGTFLPQKTAELRMTQTKTSRWVPTPATPVLTAAATVAFFQEFNGD